MIWMSRGGVVGRKSASAGRLLEGRGAQSAISDLADPNSLREALPMAKYEFTRRAAFGGLAAGLAPLVPSAASGQSNGGSALAPQDDSGIPHRSGPRAAVTNVHAKLRHLVFADEDYGFRAGASPVENARALQEAVNQADIVHLPSGPEPIAFSAPIVVPPNTRIIGRGSGTRLISLGEVAFVCEAPGGSGGDIQAPWFEDFELFCAGSGMRFNRANGGFSDVAGQQSLMRPRIDRVRVRRAEAGNAGSKGIEFNKCFDGLIQQCEIEGFEVGYLGRGSDLVEISGRTRISGCKTLVSIVHVQVSPYRFGSGTRIVGCDLLAARECYVRSTDLDLLIEGNYFEYNAERGPLKSWAFDITVHNRVRFVGNRIELQGVDSSVPPRPYVPKFLSVTTDPGNLFVWEDNGNDGLAFGAVQWNGTAGQRYWINGGQRCHIVQRATSGVAPLSLPFNSTDVAQALPWRFSPGLPGLRNASLGASVRCVDGAFVIPYAPNDQHLSFAPLDAPITGVVDVWIKARAASAGKQITIYNTNGGAYVSKAAQALTTDFAWYKVFDKVRVTNLFPLALNKDAAHPGAIQLGELVVTPA